MCDGREGTRVPRSRKQVVHSNRSRHPWWPRWRGRNDRCPVASGVAAIPSPPGRQVPTTTLWVTLGSAELAVADTSGERGPLGCGADQCWSDGVLAVADGAVVAAQIGDLDAVAARSVASAGLAPGGAGDIHGAPTLVRPYQHEL